ncbi:MAG TPA: prepilin-type N-terminal cleavage/methylation domain-containing protein, partial [Gammaproteobacteria bacterium]|nr:prepilin-type N-terminal cleavage/methylation domain-containing protein [Gammaproteobacteria bacterium]
MPRRLPSHPRQAVAGFTLPELIGALAVTGIVAAVAVSAYRTYLVRSQIAYSVELSSPIRGRVAAAFRSTGLPLSSVEQPGAGTDSAGGL